MPNRPAAARAVFRQSYARVGKRALIRHRRCAHAKQFKRAQRALKTLRRQLGRVIRDIGRKIGDDAALRDAFDVPLRLARRVATPLHRCRGGQFVAHVAGSAGQSV